MSDSRMTELNEILGGRPSRFAFRVLRTLLDTWPEQTGRDEAIRLAEAAFGRWPARTRSTSRPIATCRFSRSSAGQLETGPISVLGARR